MRRMISGTVPLLARCHAGGMNEYEVFDCALKALDHLKAKRHGHVTRVIANNRIDGSAPLPTASQIYAAQNRLVRGGER